MGRGIVGLRLWWVGILVLGTTAVGTAAPTSAPADEQQIRDAAVAVMDPAGKFDPRVVDSVVVDSDLERRFATEMVKAMRAEYDMFLRAAAAATGEKDGFLVRTVRGTAENTRRAIASAKPVVDGDSATMAFSPGAGDSTTLYFHKVDGKWRFDLLRRYRERNQIDEDGINVWLVRQRAAENVANRYERKEKRNFVAIRQVYEEEKARLLVSGVRPATRP